MKAHLRPDRFCDVRLMGCAIFETRFKILWHSQSWLCSCELLSCQYRPTRIGLPLHSNSQIPANTYKMPSDAPMKRISILGSTGSIGRQCMAVVDALPGRFEIVAIAAGSNIALAAEQVARYRP